MAAARTNDTTAPGRGQRATISDVAALAGVSVAAVSKVINGRPGISEATARRVRDAARELRWSPSSAAVALRGARNRTIGLVAARDPDLLVMDPHFAVLISGIEAELAPRGYGLLLHLVGGADAADGQAVDVRTGLDAEAEVYRRLAGQRRVDGILLTESRIGDPRFGLLRELGLPAVLLGAPQDGDDISRVATDDGRGVREAAIHLVGLGHRRITYVHGPGDRVHTQARLTQFAQAAIAAGGTAPQAVELDGFGGDEAVAAAERILDLPPGLRPTALVFANDSMAVAGMSAALRLGLRVPDDVSIVGHDDLPLGQWIHPRLTTIHQDVVALGRAGARALLHLLGEQTGAPVTVRPTRLVVRQSSGPVTP